MKNCSVCGRPLKDARFDMCYNCHQKSRSIPDDYLKDGYFTEKGHLRIELLTSTADHLAKVFGFDNLSRSQLRRFYGHVRAAENRLEMLGDFEPVKVDIFKLDSFVAEAKGKGKVPESFYRFVKSNLAQVTDEKSFKKGFLEHFQAVVAYCANYLRKE
jgi:CRISPR type III-A-associated protein Csm2